MIKIVKTERTELVISALDKGKHAYVHKPKPRPKLLASKYPKLNLEKRSQLEREAYNGDDSSTSSDDNQATELYSEFSSFRGESSRQQIMSNKRDKVKWAIDSRLTDVMGHSDENQDWAITGSSNSSGKDGPIRPHKRALMVRLIEMLEDGQINSVLATEPNTEVPDSFFEEVHNEGESRHAPKQRDNLISVVLNIENEEGDKKARGVEASGVSRPQTLNNTKKGRGKKKNLFLQRQSMRTQKSASHEKVKHEEIRIEVVDTEGFSRIWSLEEEIVKVIETGVALGIDFKVKE
ncbi:hypothetical protein QYF36_012804 [Acer negundo]|nr:hypothetical protein QYF36_012804 [Acer negundo]